MSDDDPIRRGDALARVEHADFRDDAYRAIAALPSVNPHDYQPSMDPNDQGECVICGGGPHTGVSVRPAATQPNPLAVPEVRALVEALDAAETVRVVTTSGGPSTDGQQWVHISHWHHLKKTGRDLCAALRQIGGG